MLKRILISILLFPALLSAQSITLGAHVGPPYTVDCSNSTTGTLSFTSIGTYNAGNVFRVEISDAAGVFPTYPLYVGTLALIGVNPSGLINLSIPAGIANGNTAYLLRIVASNPIVTSGNTAAFTINNASAPCSNGQLIVNEFSQGNSGSREYIELLVIGATPCSVVDIRHMIVDDNNGDYSGGAQSSVGIAQGHIRFDSSTRWERLLSGTLILLYNAADKNTSITLADDPTDGNLDMVFVISVTAAGVTTGMEGTPTTGVNSLPSSSNSSYSPVTYGNTSWTTISLANDDDAVQTRTASATAMHGLSWGTPLMVAGPGVFIGISSTSGENAYNNSTSSWTNSADYVSANVAALETPGYANSTNNMTLIGANTCIILPSELINFQLTKKRGQSVNVSWRTEDEHHVDFYSVEHSVNGVYFEPVEHVFANNSNGQNDYQITDNNAFSGINYYRILTKDKNGDVKISQVKSINLLENGISTIALTEDDEFFHLDVESVDENATLQVLNMSGALLFSQKLSKINGTLKIQKNELPAGVLVFSVIQSNQVSNFKKINIK